MTDWRIVSYVSSKRLLSGGSNKALDIVTNTVVEGSMIKIAIFDSDLEQADIEELVNQLDASSFHRIGQIVLPERHRSTISDLFGKVLKLALVEDVSPEALKISSKLFRHDFLPLVEVEVDLAEITLRLFSAQPKPKLSDDAVRLV
jgi:hypothetical protein